MPDSLPPYTSAVNGERRMTPLSRVTLERTLFSTSVSYWMTPALTVPVPVVLVRMLGLGGAAAYAFGTKLQLAAFFGGWAVAVPVMFCSSITLTLSALSVN